MKSSGRSTHSLTSQAVIADDDWHRIGFTWDGLNRRLYVDDVLVAKDPQNGLAGPSGKTLIGCGKTAAAGTFWTGLIDDVRIYSRVVKP